MSKYTTGEMAKLCDVTVRTVQYYDSRAILVPSELSEGGRRLYSEDDLKKLKTICFLRSAGLSIDGIATLLNDNNADNVIEILLKQQLQLLRDEIEDRKKKLRIVEQLAQELKSRSNFSVETIGDIAFTMKNNKSIRKIYISMILTGIFMDIIGVGSLLLWIFKGVWWPFTICAPIVVLCGVLITKLYYQKTAYICPECHTVFRPRVKQFLFSAHTPKTRKLTCTCCGHKGFCVETYNETSPAN